MGLDGKDQGSNFFHTDQGASLDESESESDICDEMLVLSHLVDEVADLSQLDSVRVEWMTVSFHSYLSHPATFG